MTSLVNDLGRAHGGKTESSSWHPPPGSGSKNSLINPVTGVWGCAAPHPHPKDTYRSLNPQNPGCDLIWRQGLYRGQVNMRSWLGPNPT